ncbi:hypothetical protein VTJ83DRAFT_5186 [Remersonia thermophila]|uniref:tripeptidyl-peptidase II n=1 Tax=Remersonia thermophila TaxID=72144 RepID=A0ABR4DC33_9PEZI
MRSLLVAVLLGVGLVANSAQAASSVLLEEATEIPPGWSFQGNASGSDRMTLYVALKQPWIEQLKTALHRRQNPHHPSFGRHWSRDEVLQHRRPARASARLVESWLRSKGVHAFHEQGAGVISFEATARMVKSLFDADLGYYSFEGDHAPVLRARSYAVPGPLRNHIQFVHPLSNFMPPRISRVSHGDQAKAKARKKKKPSKCKPQPTTSSSSSSSSSTVSATSSASLTSSTSSTSSTISTSSTSAISSISSIGTTSSTSSTITTITTTSPSSTTSSAEPTNTREPTFEEIFPNLPCFPVTVPSCIKKLYNITYTPPTRTSPVRLGVAGFLEQWILHSDVSQFLTDNLPLVPRSYRTSLAVELINNATNPQDSPSNAGVEASLDVQYAMGVGYPAQVTYYITGGRGTELDPYTGEAFPAELSDNEPYLEFLEHLLAKPDEELPHVLSISYADDEPGVPRAYAERVCDMFAALTARGVTVLAATGDAGAAGQGQTRCFDRRTQSRRFVATFPASCPYVTAVGAVDNIAPPVAGAPYSAGGFSDFFARPAWQDEAVRPYLERLRRNYTARAELAHRLALFNHTGRATPDISAVGSAFQILLAGDYSSVMGTSASTPVVAAMVALVNDARLRAGKPPLGWLNPLLYQQEVRRVLRDVTVGTSLGCWFDGTDEPGWEAVEGYDAVTGLGTVNDFWDFMQALM